MSTINTFTSGDSGSSIMGDLNTNFSNLNTDKIEDDSTDTLTNKTIDVDSNTVSNIETDNLKSSAKTGSDSKVVTGTAGADDTIATWNADGDLVTESISSTTTAPTSSSDDTTIPTSAATHTAINTALTGQNEIFIYPSLNSASSTLNPFNQGVGNWYTANADASDAVFFHFRVPSNFSSLTSLKVVMIPDTTETIDYSLQSDYGSVNEDYDNHSESDSNVQPSVTSGKITEVDASTVFTSMAGSDYCALEFDSNTNDLRVIGLYFKYAV